MFCHIRPFLVAVWTGNDELRSLPIKRDDLAPLHQPCFLAIRPEHLVISKTGDSLENALPASVREIHFAGATSTIKLDARGLSLEALVLQPDGLSVGDSCIVALPQGRISLLKNE